MKYELFLLIDEKLDEAAVDSVIDKYEKFINKNNGKFIGAEKWGKRDLMVNFRKKNNHDKANYILINFEDTKKQLTKLNYTAKIDEQIIRHMVVKNNEKATQVA